MPFFSRARGRYQMMLHSPTRPSSDDDSLDNEGLLEKKAQYLRQTRPFWRRYAPLIVAHFFLLVIYIMLLYFVAASSRAQCLNGPHLVFCRS